MLVQYFHKIPLAPFYCTVHVQHCFNFCMNTSIAKMMFFCIDFRTVCIIYQLRQSEFILLFIVLVCCTDFS